MFIQRLNAFPQAVYSIHPGEFYVSDDDVVIATVLGSCVAVALRDPLAGIGGLNHFMLPGSSPVKGASSGWRPAAKAEREAAYFASGDARYGMFAMEVLINTILKKGGRKERLEAKVFGGASVLRKMDGGLRDIAANNIEFSFKYLSQEDIPVISSDIGGTAARKLLFFIASGKVLLKRLGRAVLPKVEEEEDSYVKGLHETRPSHGTIVWLDDAFTKR